MPEPISVLVKEYGPWILLVYLVLKELWPPVRDRLIPHYAAERRARREMQDETKLIELEAATEERRRRACHDEEMDRRTVEALEQQAAAWKEMGGAIKDMAVTMASNMALTNERLLQLLGGFAEANRKAEEHDKTMRRMLGREDTQPIGRKRTQ